MESTEGSHRMDDMTNMKPIEMELKDNGTNGEVVGQDHENKSSGWMGTAITRMSGSTESFLKKNKWSIKIIFLFILNGLIVGYFFGALYYFLTYSKEPLQLCQGFGSLAAFLGIIYFFVIYFKIVKRFFGKWFNRVIWRKVSAVCSKFWKITIFKWSFGLCVVVVIALYLYWDTRGSTERLVPLSGMSIILLLAFTFSAHRSRINWRSVIMGLVIQFLFGLIFIRWTAGRTVLQCFSEKVAVFLSYGVEGAAFTFGNLLVRTEQVFAFSTLPVIFFFSMLVEVLFFWGALQWFCLKLGELLRTATDTTVCESVIAVGNCFLGNTESILLVKPYLAVLTPSELHVIMSSGFATVSGTILAAYIGFGASPAHLVTASVMSAPAAICLGKLLMPETRPSLTTVDNIQPIVSQDESALSAATRGATNGISLILNIIANLVAFVSFIAFVSGFLGYCGALVGIEGLNLEWIFGKIFVPVAFVMGVPWDECEYVGALIGLKTVVNEFVAYQRMGEMLSQGLLSPRSELIATFSLCGFTNPSSAGIMIGAMSAIAPNQREVLSSIALRAFLTGCGICFMNACIAALLMPGGSI